MFREFEISGNAHVEAKHAASQVFCKVCRGHVGSEEGLFVRADGAVEVNASDPFCIPQYVGAAITIFFNEVKGGAVIGE